MAWFFHMLTTKRVPHAVASIVADDVQAGFNYLPDRDPAVVKDQLFRPYGFDANARAALRRQRNRSCG